MLRKRMRSFMYVEIYMTSALGLSLDTDWAALGYVLDDEYSSTLGAWFEVRRRRGETCTVNCSRCAAPSMQIRDDSRDGRAENRRRLL